MNEPERQAPVDYIERTRSLYSSLGFGEYRWVVSETPPAWTPVEKPLSESKIGLISSGGVYVAGQRAFHHRDDTSVRIIDTAHTRTEDLRASHFAYDLTDARRDPNVVFPVDTLKRLEAEGFIGSLSQYAYTFMGGIYSARKVRELIAPDLSARLAQDQVDLALLVPV